MNKTRVLVLGATGMLGHMVYNNLKSLNKYELYGSVFRNPLNENSIICDVKNYDNVEALFTKTRPHIVVNCIGALVLESKINPTNAIYLNALFPHILKDLCNTNKARLVHISTDCVFSGANGNYSENDFRDADDIYGRSKALGEIYDEPHCTLRTSIIGPELKMNGTGLFHWFMSKENGSVINGYSNVYWGGVTTLELSKVIDLVISSNNKGLYNITNGVKISKYELLVLLNKYFEKHLVIEVDGSVIHDKSLKTDRSVGLPISTYDDMIKAMKEYMVKQHLIYKNYFKS